MGLHPTSSNKGWQLWQPLHSAFHSTAAGIPLDAGRPNARGQLVSQMLAGFQDETVSFYVSFCSVVWGPGEHSKIQIYIIYIYLGAKSSGDVATMLGCFSGSKITLSCILQSSHFMHSTMSKWYGVSHDTEKDYDHDQQVNLTSTSAWIHRVMGSMVCFCCQSCHRIINP